MSYSVNYSVHVARTPTRKTFKTSLEAKFKFNDEIKLESEADADFKRQVKERIGGYKSEYKNLFDYLVGQGWRFDGNDKFTKDNKQMQVYLYFFKSGFDIGIKTDGRVAEKDLIDLEAINDYILKGSPEDNQIIAAGDTVALDGFGDDIKLSANPSVKSSMLDDDSDLVLGGDNKIDLMNDLSLSDSDIDLLGGERISENPSSKSSQPKLIDEDLSLDPDFDLTDTTGLSDSDADSVLGGDEKIGLMDPLDSGLSLVDPADSGLDIILPDSGINLTSSDSGISLSGDSGIILRSDKNSHGNDKISENPRPKQ